MAKATQDSVEALTSKGFWWCQTLRPFLGTWKVRLPLVALPVMASMRRLVGNRSVELDPGTIVFETALVLAVTLGTGLFQIPFTVTWWLLLIAAFAMETQLLVGVATVLSLTIILSWYGTVLRHPHAISALWSCGAGKAVKEMSGAEVPVTWWKVCDLVVHGLPAVLMLLWHGPSIGLDGVVTSGTVTTFAVALALPLNIIWFCGMNIGLRRAPWKARLSDTNAVYRVEPLLPDSSFQWIYGSHLAMCSLWLTLISLPTSVSQFVAMVPLTWGWHLFARSYLRKDLLMDRVNFFVIAHLLGCLGLFRAVSHQSSLRVWLEVVAMWQIGGFGITCGAHRLWSHRSYVAKLPFRMLLMLLNTFANQGTIYHWSRDHRAHHKWTDTPADPHDTTRGFFYAHIGWLLVPKTEELKVKGKDIPMDDLLADPAVAFQKWAEEKFMFMELVSFGLPTLYGRAAYGDALFGFLVFGVLRWLITLHATWCVNSVAHYIGEQKYDGQASARQSLLTAILADGEGWHSYHHKYPWDYATSEFGAHRQWNPSKILIDVAAMLGQVQHVKRADHIARKALDAQGKQTTGVWKSSYNPLDKDAPQLPTKGQIRAAIPAECFERSALHSMYFVLRDSIMAVALVYVTSQFLSTDLPSEFLSFQAFKWVVGWNFYAFWMGTILTGHWVLAHECGHGAFSPSQTFNNICGFIMHQALLVPYFAWQYTHAKHHRRTNHLMDGESHVPSVGKENGLGPNNEREGAYAVIHEALGDGAFAGLQVFTHLVLGWPLYLMGLASTGKLAADGSPLAAGEIIDHFRPNSRMFTDRARVKVFISSVGVVLALGLLFKVSLDQGFITVGLWYGAPYMWVNAWLVLYTWLQHSDPSVPQYGPDEWTWIKGALSTIDRPYGIFDFFHHKIGSTHVAHHLFHEMPFYKADIATAALREYLGPLYNYDPTPWYMAMWRVAKKCHYVEDTKGIQFYKSMEDVPLTQGQSSKQKSL